MLSEIGRNPAPGALSYILHGELKDINTSQHEKNHLIMLRNDIVVQVMSKEIDLPEPSWKEFACPKCPYNTICSVFQQNDENISDNTKQLFFNFVSHLTKNDLDYFFRWINIVCLEHEESKKSNSLHSIWTDDAKTRVLKGGCISNLKLLKVFPVDDGFIHTFETDSVQNDHKVRSKKYCSIFFFVILLFKQFFLNELVRETE